MVSSKYDMVDLWVNLRSGLSGQPQTWLSSGPLPLLPTRPVENTYTSCPYLLRPVNVKRQSDAGPIDLDLGLSVTAPVNDSSRQ